MSGLRINKNQTPTQIKVETSNVKIHNRVEMSLDIDLLAEAFVNEDDGALLFCNLLNNFFDRAANFADGEREKNAIAVFISKAITKNCYDFMSRALSLYPEKQTMDSVKSISQRLDEMSGRI